MSKITLDSCEVAARLAAAIDESAAEIRNVTARTTEIAALSASIAANQLRVNDAEKLERIEALAHAVLHHMQAHHRLVHELMHVCESLGHPVAAMPRFGARSVVERPSPGDAVEAAQSHLQQT